MSMTRDEILSEIEQLAVGTVFDTGKMSAPEKQARLKALSMLLNACDAEEQIDPKERAGDFLKNLMRDNDASRGTPLAVVKDAAEN